MLKLLGQLFSPLPLSLSFPRPLSLSFPRPLSPLFCFFQLASLSLFSLEVLVSYGNDNFFKPRWSEVGEYEMKIFLR